MANPTKFNPHRTKLVLDAVRSGVWFEDACLDAGVSAECVRNWARQGDAAGEGPYFEFACALRKARREANAPHLVNIHAAEEKDWKAAAWYLERKERKRFGPQVKIEVDALFDKVTAALSSSLNAEEFRRVVEIIDNALSGEAED